MEIDITEDTLQEKVDRLVRNEVVYCVSGLVSEILSRDQDGGLLDEFPGLFQGPPSIGNWECRECLHTWEGESEEWKCAECGYDNEDDWYSSFEATEYQEIFEHWIVSDYLADRLEEFGEAVERDFYGLTIWGRTTTGQMISMDWVIGEIVKGIQKD